jgi:hypothetical protein
LNCIIALHLLLSNVRMSTEKKMQKFWKFQIYYLSLHHINNNKVDVILRPI